MQQRQSYTRFCRQTVVQNILELSRDVICETA
jgi:hypothetical protein